MELVLVRHARPERIDPSPDGAPVDPPLTELGRTQADRVARWLAPEPIDAIVTSPLRRARETAAPLATALGIVPVVDDDLREYDADADHYIPVEEMREDHADYWSAMVEGRWTEFGGEDPEHFRARLVPAFDRIVAAYPGGRVVVVCHGGVINVYTAVVLGIDRHLWFLPEYTSVTRVMAAREGGRGLHTLNETGHLHADRFTP